MLREILLIISLAIHLSFYIEMRCGIGNGAMTIATELHLTTDARQRANRKNAVTRRHSNGKHSNGACLFLCSTSHLCFDVGYVFFSSLYFVLTINECYFSIDFPCDKRSSWSHRVHLQTFWRNRFIQQQSLVKQVETCESILSSLNVFHFHSVLLTNKSFD